MLAVLSGGGTAGHINPALALAEELQNNAWNVKFAGTPTGVESRLVPEAHIEFKAFEAKGFNRRHPLSLPKALATIARSTKEARAWLQDIKPDVVVGFGGYVSIPVTRAAKQLNIPIVIHEQNSVMGMANKYMAKYARKVCLTYACAGAGIAAEKLAVTGNPVRSSVLRATRAAGREMLNIPDDAEMLLVFGGSLGARHINNAIVALKEELLAHERLYVVHVTGPKEFEAVSAALHLTEDEQKRWLLFDYQNRMGDTLAAADVVVSRAGATSLAEISALGIPALLVPFPYATADHQTMNAQALVESGCSLMMPDDALETQEFKTKLFSLIEDETLREAMRAALLAKDSANASARLAELVCSVAG